MGHIYYIDTVDMANCADQRLCTGMYDILVKLSAFRLILAVISKVFLGNQFFDET